MKYLFSLLIILILCAGAYAEDDPVMEMDKIFQTYNGLTLHYSGISGDIQINTWDKEEASIKVYANSYAKKNMEIQIIDGNGGIIITESSRYSSARGQNLRLRYEITLPVSYNATFNTSSSDISISNLEGNVHIQSSGSDLNINNLEGNLTVSTASGDLTAFGITGNLHATTSSGNVTVSNIKGKATATSSSGDIVIKDASEKTHISSVSGDVNFICTESNPGATINTTSGDIIIDLGTNVSASLLINDGSKLRQTTGYYYNDPGQNRQEVNGGGATIYCTTTSGEIIINDDLE